MDHSIWKKKVACWFFVPLLMLPATARAQTFELLEEQDTWKLYRADDVPMTIKGHAPGLYDGLCIAQSTVDGVTLQFMMLPPELHEFGKETGFVSSVHVYGDAWNFKQRKAFAALSVGTSSIANKQARYSGDLIAWDVLEFEPFSIFMMFAGVSDEIVVLNRKKKPVARFPTAGFAFIRDKLFDCAGVQ